MASMDSSRHPEKATDAAITRRIMKHFVGRDISDVYLKRETENPARWAARIMFREGSDEWVKGEGISRIESTDNTADDDARQHMLPPESIRHPRDLTL